MNANQTTEGIVAGHRVQIDRSGQGHAWRKPNESELTPQVVMEIEGEIIDGKQESGQIVASNGLHYRWLA